MTTESITILSTCYLQINNEEVIERALTKEWQDQFYYLPSRRAVLSHIARNLTHGCTINELDGWTDVDPDAVILIDEYTDYET